MRSTGCRHMFCKDCWRGYIMAAVEAGPGVLDLRCPVPDCNAAVRTVLWHTSATHPRGILTCRIVNIYRSYWVRVRLRVQC